MEGGGLAMQHDRLDGTAPTRMPVWVVTGFLGSGKTTLLNALLRDAALSQAAVVVGEYGEVGLDHVLVSAPRKRVRLVDSGCICGHVQDEIAARLLDLDEHRHDSPDAGFDCVLIETSGLADPVPIVQLLLTDAAVSRRFELRSVVTVFDAVRGLEQLDEHPEAAKQVAVADTLLISKTDLAGDAAVEAVRERLRVLNPAARVLAAAYGRAEAGGVLAPAAWSATSGAPAGVSERLADLARMAESGGADERGPIRTLSLVHEGEITQPGLVLWLNLFASVRAAGMLRMKGLVNVEGRPVAIHAVQRVLSEPVELEAWPDEDRRSRIVIIARGMDEVDIRGTFEAFRTEAGRARRNMTLDPANYEHFRRVMETFRRPAAAPSARPLEESTR
ncbi:MAG: CobW family GTP-binding protein [Pseudomonadota bacterium]|jgi:G3E family GTPase